MFNTHSLKSDKHSKFGFSFFCVQDRCRGCGSRGERERENGKEGKGKMK